jgi:hypothetical protein
MIRLCIVALAGLLVLTASASAQRGLYKGGLVQRGYLTDEQRAARGLPPRGGGASGVSTVAKSKKKKKT